MEKDVQNMKVKNSNFGIVHDNLEVDYYNPITLEFPENDDKKEELYYYRFINKSSSFIEIKVNSSTSKIVSITVTSINDIKEGLLDFTPYIEANPIINLDIFSNETVVTNNQEFDIQKKDKSVYYILDSETVESVIKVSKHLYIFINKNERIIGMQFLIFDDNDWKEINESIEYCIQI